MRSAMNLFLLSYAPLFYLFKTFVLAYDSCGLKRNMLQSYVK